ncbi:MAG TPA: hypothetical protein VFJ90_15880 [Candidatus Didemnitutus sp.]|nr:hypothetical protein [Candidatus Didemnitutus sp.]
MKKLVLLFLFSAVALRADRISLDDLFGRSTPVRSLSAGGSSTFIAFETGGSGDSGGLSYSQHGSSSNGSSSSGSSSNSFSIFSGSGSLGSPASYSASSTDRFGGPAWSNADSASYGGSNNGNNGNHGTGNNGNHGTGNNGNSTHDDGPATDIPVTALLPGNGTGDSTLCPTLTTSPGGTVSCPDFVTNPAPKDCNPGPGVPVPESGSVLTFLIALTFCALFAKAFEDYLTGPF